MLIERDGHPGRASHVPTTEAASTIGRRDLTAPTERDLQRSAGDTIDKTMANAIIDCTYQRLVRFALNGVTSATVTVLRAVSSTPPLLTHDGVPPARPRLATGLPPDTTTLHATFGHAPGGALRANCTACSLPISKPRRRA